MNVCGVEGLKKRDTIYGHFGCLAKKDQAVCRRETPHKTCRVQFEPIVKFLEASNAHVKLFEGNKN